MRERLQRTQVEGSLWREGSGRTRTQPGNQGGGGAESSWAEDSWPGPGPLSAGSSPLGRRQAPGKASVPKTQRGPRVPQTPQLATQVELGAA